MKHHASRWPALADAQRLRTEWRAGRAPLYPGPLCGGEAGTTGPQGNRHGCRFLFARTGVLSKSPAPPHGLAGQGCPASAKWGVVFSWLLLFWTSKREVTRPPQEDETLLGIEATQTAKPEHRD